MKPCCSIGAWPDHEAIDADIRAQRVGIRVIAKKYNVSKGQVEKHKKCLAVVGGPRNGAATVKDEPEVEEPEERLPGEDGPVEVDDAGNWRVLTPAEAQEAKSRPVEVVEFVPKTTKTVGKTAGQDSDPPPSRELVRAKQDTEKGYARARVWGDPKGLVSWADRVEYVADLIASGQWHGRPTARRLQAVWAYENLSTVWRLHGEAHRALNLHRGPLLEQRAETVERLRRIGRQARKEGDHRAAIAAEAEAAKIEGTYNNGNPSKKPQDDAGFVAWYQRMIERLKRDGHEAAIAVMEDECRAMAGETDAA